MDRDGLVAELDALLRPELFSDGQSNGLQVEGRDTVERVMSAVSVNQATIDAAVDWGADALLTHHGIFWKTDPMHVRGLRRRRLATLLGHGINLISYHLPLDAHAEFGNNACLARAAGCHKAEPSFAYQGQTIGMLGDLEQAIVFDDWVRAFEAALRTGCAVDTGPFQVWAHGPEKIQRIGFLSGAAPYSVHDALAAGCDAFVTGEAAEAVYHVAKEAGIHFIAGGHYLTERLGVQRLGQWLEGQGMEHRFFDVETRV